MNRIRDIFRANLIRLRKEQNLSVKKLAKILNLNRGTIYKLEKGMHPVSPELMDKLCEYFNLEPDYFFFDPNKVDDDLKDIPPELLSGLRQAKNLPPEIRKSVIDFIRFQVAKNQEKMKEQQNK